MIKNWSCPVLALCLATFFTVPKTVQAEFQLGTSLNIHIYATAADGKRVDITDTTKFIDILGSQFTVQTPDVNGEITREIYTYDQVLEALSTDNSAKRLVSYCGNVYAISSATMAGTPVGLEVSLGERAAPCNGWFPETCPPDKCAVTYGPQNPKIYYRGRCGWDPWLPDGVYCPCVRGR
ncbi:MAG: hypothetical protein K1X79_13495 [Oligoflexia bacterium]|nr:hypothetical protein [Oligoflexia bacterium]